MKYKVCFLQDNIYQVIDDDDDDYYNVLFQGTLPECQAWIWLKQNGNL